MLDFRADSGITCDIELFGSNSDDLLASDLGYEGATIRRATRSHQAVAI
jgi:hypothetical protein